MKRGRKAKCPYCRGQRTIGKGYRATATLGRRVLRYCNDCDRKFTLVRPAGVIRAATAAIVPALASATAPSASDAVASLPALPPADRILPNG